MYTMLVYPVRFEGDGENPSRIEVAFRGRDQLLPGGSIAFSSEEELRRAIIVVEESLGWNLPPEIFQNAPAIWRDVKSGDGWDFHLSKFNETLSIGEGKTFTVYRQEINSCIPREILRKFSSVFG